MRSWVVVGVLACASAARADERGVLGGYAESSAWVGDTTVGATWALRDDVGLELWPARDAQSVSIRIGPLLELDHNSTLGANRTGGCCSPSLGAALEVDWQQADAWRLGVRASVIQDGDPGALLGARVRAGVFTFGVDLVRIDAYYPDNRSLPPHPATGVVVGAGLQGRPGLYALLGGLAVGVVAVGISLACCFK